MRKLVLTATAVAMCFIATAQWNDEGYIRHNDLFKRKSFNTRSEALAEASRMWVAHGFIGDVDYLYYDEDVLSLGYFEKNNKIYGMIVTKFAKNRYDVMLTEHENEDTHYFFVGDIAYGYYKGQ